MEELGEDVYDLNEPRVYFSVAEIKQYAKLHITHIVNGWYKFGG